MRPSQCIFTAVTGVLAAVAATGCTVHTEPVRVRGSADVQLRSRADTTPPVVRSHQAEAHVAFRDVLAPYGDWIDEPVCGHRYGPVWVPSANVVGRNFMPYATGGEWVPTDQGWLYQSDFEWGWATFHYGRWCADPRYGWVWIPGSEWAPAWVDWRYGGGYVGWAPLPPAGVALHEDSYVFVDRPTFAGSRVTRYSLPQERVIEARRVARPHVTTVTHSGYSWRAGPPAAEIRVEAGADVRPVQVVPPKRGEVRRVIVRRH